MSNFSHKGGAHENAAKKKETKEDPIYVYRY